MSRTSACSREQQHRADEKNGSFSISPPGTRLSAPGPPIPQSECPVSTAPVRNLPVSNPPFSAVAALRLTHAKANDRHGWEADIAKQYNAVIGDRISMNSIRR